LLAPDKPGEIFERTAWRSKEKDRDRSRPENPCERNRSSRKNRVTNKKGGGSMSTQNNRRRKPVPSPPEKNWTTRKKKVARQKHSRCGGFHAPPGAGGDRRKILRRKEKTLIWRKTFFSCGGTVLFALSGRRLAFLYGTKRWTAEKKKRTATWGPRDKGNPARKRKKKACEKEGHALLRPEGSLVDGPPVLLPGQRGGRGGTPPQYLQAAMLKYSQGIAMTTATPVSKKRHSGRKELVRATANPQQRRFRGREPYSSEGRA